MHVPLLVSTAPQKGAVFLHLAQIFTVLTMIFLRPYEKEMNTELRIMH